MRVSVFDKVLLKQTKSFSFPAKEAHVRTESYTSLLLEEVSSHAAHQRKPWAEKQRGSISHQHPLRQCIVRLIVEN